MCQIPPGVPRRHQTRQITSFEIVSVPGFHTLLSTNFFVTICADWMKTRGGKRNNCFLIKQLHTAWHLKSPQTPICSSMVKSQRHKLVATHLHKRSLIAVAKNGRRAHPTSVAAGRLARPGALPALRQEHEKLEMRRTHRGVTVTLGEGVTRGRITLCLRKSVS